ncbi:hypothetical protein EVAR_365_1 [Eumeta japonica]|uniref:Uncharacterized protein n=1 Tax=Eumeta variegata TaxID=151549 RepID=A0A4C1SA14_EUMVA|nr:hypothetical protein EVAR_365_1 [Eumeta japonica]
MEPTTKSRKRFQVFPSRYCLRRGACAALCDGAADKAINFPVGAAAAVTLRALTGEQSLLKKSRIKRLAFEFAMKMMSYSWRDGRAVALAVSGFNRPVGRALPLTIFSLWVWRVGLLSPPCWICAGSCLLLTVAIDDIAKLNMHFERFNLT